MRKWGVSGQQIRKAIVGAATLTMSSTLVRHPNLDPACSETVVALTDANWTVSPSADRLILVFVISLSGTTAFTTSRVKEKEPQSGSQPQAPDRQ
jgi:hypothetical protein